MIEEFISILAFILGFLSGSVLFNYKEQILKYIRSKGLIRSFRKASELWEVIDEDVFALWSIVRDGEVTEDEFKRIIKIIVDKYGHNFVGK